jgi:xanthine/uracil/vitamin C permease (AzgA family)
VRALRNIAIIALIAVPVAFLPGGGAAARAVLAALGLLFLATIGFAAYQGYRSNSLTITTLPDLQRAVFWSAVGLIVLMIAAADEMLDTAGGTLVWIGLLALSVVAILRVWTEAHRY